MDTLKILVVDDESRMRKLVKDFLTKKNFQVLEAGDGEEAMDIFYKEKDIALIILDVMMPKMDGWEVCREVRKNSKVPIIMLTAKGDDMDGREIPPVQLCHIPQVNHIGKVAFRDGDRGFFDLACPYRLNAAAHRRQWEHADPVEQAPQPERCHLNCVTVP